MLQPTQAYSSQEAQLLIAKIAGMLNRGEIKTLKGSLSDPQVNFEFKVKGTTESWALRGILDAHGGLILSRIN